MRVAFQVETDISTTLRARQVSAMFDVPPAKKCTIAYDLDFPIDDGTPWSVGLVVGPSGSGKTSVMRHVWGEPPVLEWKSKSIVDDFPSDVNLEGIAGVCSAVGFNTVPAWMRPYAVLSNGEKFRVDLARRLLGGGVPPNAPIVVDEFTSVVDRQVAQIGAHAVQKYIRKAGKQFVAVGCHYDVLDWLQPDWVLDMATRSFTRRRLQRRPSVECVVGRVPRSAWTMFAPYHYMSAALVRNARSFGLSVKDRLVAFAGIVHRPHARVDDIKGVSRLVTLPDWQGLGLAMVLVDTLGAAYKGHGQRLRTYPAHPALMRVFDRSENWTIKKVPGFSQRTSRASGTSSLGAARDRGELQRGGMGGRPCAIFEYSGPALPRKEAQRVLGVNPYA